MEYTLENMPKEARTLYDVVYVHIGEYITMESLCYWMELNSKLVDDVNRIRNLIKIHRQVEQNIWQSYARIERDGIMFYDCGDGIYITRKEAYKDMHIPFCAAHKVLRLRAGRGNKVYTIPDDIEIEEQFYEKEIQSKAFGLARQLVEGLRRDHHIRLKDGTTRKLLDIFTPLRDGIKEFLLNDRFPKLSEGESIDGKPIDDNLKKCKKCGIIFWGEECVKCAMDDDKDVSEQESDDPKKVIIKTFMEKKVLTEHGGMATYPEEESNEKNTK